MTEPRAATSRISSVDWLRGAAMVAMAIDHVRVYSGLPAGGPTAGIFFTRWITHFCAPTFVLLAGTSALLHGSKHAGLSRFLVLRGAWLVILELTVLRIAWTFNVDFAHYEMAGVIWMLGWCMILIAALVKLPVRVVGALGVVIIAGHNLLDAHVQAVIPALGDDAGSGLWKILYVGFFAGPVKLGAGPPLIVLYSIIPWLGVMMAGYAFGTILLLEPRRRDRLCLGIGLGATLLFLVLRGVDLYGDPRPWSAGNSGAGRMPAVFAFLSTNKYPASLDFLLMTLGPTIVAISLVERAHGALSRTIAMFGRVPLFFYVLHIPLIHALALAISLIRAGEISPWLFANHPMGAPPAPDGYAWSLPLLYLVWAIAIAILYFACRWFVELKRRRSDWWLSYL